LVYAKRFSAILLIAMGVYFISTGIRRL
jgi:small neutral amino acid transporter SnatA (MarC family)